MAICCQIYFRSPDQYYYRYYIFYDWSQQAGGLECAPQVGPSGRISDQDHWTAGRHTLEKDFYCPVAFPFAHTGHCHFAN